MKPSSVLAGLAAAILFVSTAGAATAPVPVRGEQIWSSEQFTVHSAIVGRDFLIQVAKPQDPPGPKPATLYVTDGNQYFGLAASTMYNLGGPGETQRAFVVAITNPAMDFADWYQTRQTDLTFTPAPPGTSGGPVPGDKHIWGGGDKFKRFLTEELRPLIEARYPVDPHRAILVGHSLGGLFAAHVLLNDPKAFDAYVIGSPALSAEPGLLEQASRFKAPASLQIYVGAGAQEETATSKMVSNAGAFARSLAEQNPALKVQFYAVDGAGHEGMMPAFLSAAIRFLLPKAPG